MVRGWEVRNGDGRGLLLSVMTWSRTQLWEEGGGHHFHLRGGDTKADNLHN